MSELSEILNNSPSVELLRLKNREAIIVFLAKTFTNQQGPISSEVIHSQLADYLDYKQIENDEENEIEVFDSYEVKAKKYILNWTNKGFLTNYQDERGEIFYEISTHSNKTIDWLSSLKKEEYVGTESKFRNIFVQLKELVEFSNENREKRIQLLRERKYEIEKQIEKLEIGEDVKVYEDFEIVPRFRQLNQAAKELLSDFKEVEGNFKEITKSIYQKHADGSLTKSDILGFTFEALDELKVSQQGKSFYAFWSFLLNPDWQQEWEKLVNELYETLQEKGLEVSDPFLKSMKKRLHYSGQKVYKANDKMAEKLSRIIRENEDSKAEVTRNLIQEIKRSLIEISKAKRRPDISLELETDTEVNLSFERRLTYEQSEELIYKDSPKLADEDIIHANQLSRLFAQTHIDKDLLRSRIKEVLHKKSQTTIKEVIENFGGIEKGLPELFGYLGIMKDYRHSISSEKTEKIIFDIKNLKSIEIPEVILTK